MTVSTPDDYGPVIPGECYWCGDPIRTMTAPVCPGCHGQKPHKLIMQTMGRMLKRAAAAARA